MQNVEKLFLDLVKIPSPSGNEDGMRMYVKRILSNYTKSIYIDTVGNIYARFAGSGEPLLLCAHLDTVLPAGSLVPIVDSMYIRADGKNVLGSDNKCAIAAILSTIINIYTHKKTHRSFEVLFSVREETEAGIRNFPRKRIQACTGLIADVSEPIGTVIVGAPFVYGYAISVTAPGLHTAKITSETIHPLNFLTAFVKKIPFGKRESDTIINIAKIRMGESYNSVPQLLYFTGELRTFKKAKYDQFIKFIQKTVRQLDSTFHTKSTIEHFPYSVGYMLHENDTKEVKRIFKTLHIPYTSKTTFSVGDFNFLNEWGIKTVNIGNGTLEPHTTRERIKRSSLAMLEKIFEAYLSI